jgi:hypothetical protein
MSDDAKPDRSDGEQPFDLEAYKKAIEEEFEKSYDETSDAQELLTAHAQDAALQVVVIMNHCPDPRLRFRAATYLLDNTIFAKGNNEDSLRKFLEGLNAPTKSQ